MTFGGSYFGQATFGGSPPLVKVGPVRVHASATLDLTVTPSAPGQLLPSVNADFTHPAWLLGALSAGGTLGGNLFTDTQLGTIIGTAVAVAGAEWFWRRKVGRGPKTG